MDIISTGAYIEQADNAPEDALAQYCAGEALLQSGKYDAAGAYFRRVVMMFPGHIESIRGLAICLVMRGENEDGLRLCFDLMAMSPLEFTARLVAGQALIALGLYEEAIDCYQSAVWIDYEARGEMLKQYWNLAGQDGVQADLLARAIVANFPEYQADLLPASRQVMDNHNTRKG